MTTTATSDEILTDEFSAGIDAGCRWLVHRLGDDGHPGCGHVHYYRLPWTLALTGYREPASRVLSWIERNALTPDGDLREEARVGFQDNWASYPLAIIATGAWHLERYDTALRITDTLRDFQDPDAGGAYAQHPSTRTSRRQDLFPTAQLGMTGLTTGRRELADGAFRWLSSLYAAQPDLPSRLYTATEGDQLLAVDEEDPALAWQTITDFTQPRQAFYNPGIAAAFLARYYMVTRDEAAKDLARNYLSLTEGGTERQFDSSESVQVCKFGWGVAAWLDASPEPSWHRHAVRMGHWFLEAQNEDGSWDNSPFLMEDGARDDIRVEITAEFVQHLVTIVAALGGRDRGPIASAAPPSS